jgi:TPR repeat protein
MTTPVLVPKLAPLLRRTMSHAITALLLVVATLSLGCSNVAAAQSPQPADPWPAIRAANARQDYATELRLTRPLAAKGNARAQFNLGVMYGTGQGVAQDYQEAIRWYRLAAAQGNADAQDNLGMMYSRGRGVAQDDKEAVRWFRLAAAQGYADAQYKLSVMYVNGDGVSEDYVRGHMWINVAASLASGIVATTWAKKRDLLAEGMTPAQLERAQELARQCQASDYKRCGEGAVK